MDIRITVADVIYPAAGKKQGKVIDQTGKEWYVWGDKLSGYSRGNNYVISKYKTSDFKGKTYYTIEEVSPVGVGETQQSYRAPAGGGVAIPAQQRPTPQRDDSQLQMHIFICGGFNNIMANPNVNPAMLQAADMMEFIKRLKAAWLSTMSGPPKPGDDMNDSLPEGF